MDLDIAGSNPVIHPVHRVFARHASLGFVLPRKPRPFHACGEVVTDLLTRTARRASSRKGVCNRLEYDLRNPTMATVEKRPAIDPDVLADREAVCNSKGIVRDPRLLRRITERADRARQDTLELFGVQEIGADIMRAVHDPE